MPINTTWLREQVRIFVDEERPCYAAFATALERVLKDGAARHAPQAIVQARVKETSSFAFKAVKKAGKYARPAYQLTDLCGARVIAHTLDEVERICEFVRAHFRVDEENSLDVAERLRAAEFGYRSVHYVVQLGDHPAVSKEERRKVGERKAEIQVRTLLQHVWADVMHDRTYKSGFEVPTAWLRDAARLAAVLEEADRTLSSFTSAYAEYETDLGTYLSADQIREEMEICRAVASATGGASEGIAHRMGILAMALGDWKGAVQALRRVRKPSRAALVRDLGLALCRLHAGRRSSREFQAGQAALERAIRLDPSDAAARAALAETRSAADPAALAGFREAYETAPDDPYALADYLERLVVARKGPEPLEAMHPTILDAIAKCEEHASIEINLPEAFYAASRLRLLLGQPHAFLAAGARAVDRTLERATFDRAAAAARRLTKALPDAELLERLLVLARAVHFPSKARGLKDLAAGALEGPVLIVAGDGEGRAGPERRRLLEATLKEFDGTVVSGGTTTGVPGLVAAAGKRAGVRTVGYVPRRLPEGAKIDARYAEIRRSTGSAFGPRQILSYWTDLVASGIDPRTVRLLVFGGTEISATECHIALALGASVGLIGDGEAAARVTRDGYWDACGRLARLFPDAETVAAFVAQAAPAEDPQLEAIAHGAHEIYRTRRIEEQQKAVPTWEQLDAGLQASNRLQATDIARKLRRVGYSVRPAGKRDGPPHRFTDEEVEAMAEMEHARWVVERCFAGWQLGPEKDAAARTSPHLVPWSELDEEARALDRSAVRAIPELLTRVGLEIRPDRPR